MQQQNALPRTPSFQYLFALDTDTLRRCCKLRGVESTGERLDLVHRLYEAYTFANLTPFLLLSSLWVGVVVWYYLVTYGVSEAMYYGVYHLIGQLLIQGMRMCFAAPLPTLQQVEQEVARAKKNF